MMSTAEGETLLVPTAAQDNLALSREPDADVFNLWSHCPALLVSPGHLSMLPYAMGQHLFIHDPFLVLSFGLSEPRHPDHGSVILSESSRCSPQAERVVFTTTAHQKRVAFHTPESQTTNCREMPLASNSTSSWGVRRWAVGKRHPPAEPQRAPRARLSAPGQPSGVRSQALPAQGRFPAAEV